MHAGAGGAHERARSKEDGRLHDDDGSLSFSEDAATKRFGRGAALWSVM